MSILNDIVKEDKMITYNNISEADLTIRTLSIA